MAKQTINETAENAIIAAFGLGAEDVISPIKCASETLGWLEEIFNSIVTEAKKENPMSMRIKQLAEAGSYLAMDFANMSDRRHEEMWGKLQEAGIISSGLKRSD
jgi:hypothetical protein